MKMDSLDSLTYGGVRGRENLFNFPSYSIAIFEGGDAGGGKYP